MIPTFPPTVIVVFVALATTTAWMIHPSPKQIVSSLVRTGILVPKRVVMVVSLRVSVLETVFVA